MGTKPPSAAAYIQGAVLPLLLYGAPVWAGALRFEYNRIKYVRVQRIMNIKLAKVFRTTSSEALCILPGTTPTEGRKMLLSSAFIEKEKDSINC